MKIRLKKVQDQVVVITGATSGIGLVTARMAAQRGAKLVLSARNHEALGELKREFGDRAVCVAADVADPIDVAKIVDHALERFGRIDTWVNNAGVTVIGRIEEIDPGDHRRLFDTNFWGVVNGSMAALPALKREGGALINIGSALSDRAVPLQGMYSASKHAVKGFTDALRMELESEDAPVSVTLVKPAAIDTMYLVHAKNYLAEEPKHAPPVYAPELVAEAILDAAERPIRDVFVGGSAKAISALGSWAPRTADRLMSRAMIRSQKSAEPARLRADSLYDHADDLQERASLKPGQRALERSAYTSLRYRHPVIGSVLAGVAVLGALGAALSLTRVVQPRQVAAAMAARRLLRRPSSDAL